MYLKTFIGITIFSLAASIALATVSIDDLATRSGAPLGIQGKLQVTATGSGDLSYQWYLNNNPIPRAVHAELSIAARNSTGTYTYRVRVRDNNSEVMSEEITYTVFDVGEILGIPEYEIEIEPSVDDRYTYMLQEDGGIFLRWLPEHLLESNPDYQQSSPRLRIRVQNSALVKVTHNGLLQGFGSTATNANALPINQEPYNSGDRTETNYFMSESEQWLHLFPINPWVGYRYGAHTTVKKVEITPIPQNYFLADMYRMEIALNRDITEGEIEELDFDGDGRSNLLEWMEFTNPFGADQGMQIELWPSGEGEISYLQYRWTRPLNIYPYVYIFEYSTDLLNWQPLAQPPFENLLPHGVEVQARDLEPYGSYSTRFLRVRVTSQFE